MTRVLVTGGAGFIGSHIAEELVRLGHTVCIVDDLSTGKASNIDSFRNRVGFIQGSLIDPGVAGEVVRGIELVFHNAALPSVPRSMADPVGTNRANALGTMALLQAARKAGVARFIYASSSAAYGETERLPEDESMIPVPRSPYAASKVAGELYALSYQHAEGLPVVCLRYFNVFGPRQDPSSPYAAVIPRFIMAALRGERPVVFGDGRQSRDFTYVANVVEANLLAAKSKDAVGRVINIGTGTSTTILELLSTLGRIMGKPFEPDFRVPQAGDVRHSRADITLARQLLGYEPRASFEEGLERTVAWYRQLA